jgi:hypothetical protein
MRSCECGNPATVWKNNAFICARCAEIEDTQARTERRRDRRAKLKGSKTLDNGLSEYTADIPGWP